MKESPPALRSVGPRRRYHQTDSDGSEIVLGELPLPQVLSGARTLRAEEVVIAQALKAAPPTTSSSPSRRPS